MSSYDAQFKEQLEQRRSITDARQRWLEQIYARMEAEEQARINEEAAQEAASNKNWLDEGMQGAALGGSVGGPWGALIGGIAGTAMGQKKAYDQRRKEGQGGFSAFSRTLFDTPLGSNKLTKDNMTNGAAAYSGARQRYEADQVDKRTALAEQPANNGYYQRSAVLTSNGPGGLTESGARPTYLGGLNSSGNTGFDTAQPAQVSYISSSPPPRDPRLRDPRSDPYYGTYGR